MPAERPARSRASAADTAVQVLRAYRCIQWVIGGLFAIALGMWLVLDPNLEGRVSLSAPGDRTAGICALVAGVGACVLAYLMRPRK